ncbi:Rrf2 family transcriptional regulator [Komagataeibacter intermedius]|uniref:Rrf2 family transcriptional regulator n=2 Tax=Komagataeibacter intermedius TaxID=66229 RepID=A0A0N1FK29_9PROT|nr:Rrf2 family transcriptional regulator [Komagataeibacter intermedius]KPH86202.1 Rrf2 family transcriptional regulator [Komagataeibacter intermedius AF2]MCF3635278.1 Rrf2 family transcriptional regulator [Komagataeibacter intermedius]GAN87291.1 transcriptional regulator BadM/Rrf84 [Komagataeibacter intermedius TF2]GBQ69863.1 Rrf2 family transcriptional regulator [Komagataeibacter intermedius NRIC 0521]
MRLTLYTEYSIRTLIYLGKNQGRRVAIQEIADTHQISSNHLSKIVCRLARNGMVSSRRGRTGGLELAHPTNKITLGDIVRFTEADMDELVTCEPDKGKACVLSDACRLRGILAQSLNAFMSVLDGVTLHDIIMESGQRHIQR